MGKRYSRDDVEQHADRGELRPAVNVKVYGSMANAFAAFARDEQPDPRFTMEWIDEQLSDEQLDSYFWTTCEWQWEQLVEDAEEIFGAGTSVVQEGRMGGWAVVESLPDLESWDAIQLGKWRRFERYAKGLADDIPYSMLGNIYANAFEAWSDERDDAASYNAELPVDLAAR